MEQPVFRSDHDQPDTDSEQKRLRRLIFLIKQLEQFKQFNNSSSSNSQTGGTYTVKAGDTLSSIARAHGMNYRTLMNNNNISSHLIYPGQRLNVNGSSSSSSSSSQSSSDNSSASGKKEESKSQSISAPSPSNVSYGKNYYYWGDCTWYVFERRQQLGKPVGNNWGNASNWDDAV